MFNVNELIKERDEQYGAAWLHTGRMMHAVSHSLHHLLEIAPEVYYNWVIILNKLVRLLRDPWNRDTWMDIAGYATLVVNYLDTADVPVEAKEEQNGKVHTSRSR